MDTFYLLPIWALCLSNFTGSAHYAFIPKQHQCGGNFGGDCKPIDVALVTQAQSWTTQPYKQMFQQSQTKSVYMDYLYMQNATLINNPPMHRRSNLNKVDPNGKNTQSPIGTATS